MYHDKTFLAIIPARGGSKRLPRKNVLDLAGKPLIGWSINAGLNSRYIDKVIVTSDDEEILDIAKKYDSDIIKRPDKLATDIAKSYDVVKHTINNVEKFDYIVLLQPTSPLRTAVHIDESIELLEMKKADAIVSVAEMNPSPLWANTLPQDLSMTGFLDEKIINKRSQDLEKYFILNGAIYICKMDRFLNEKTFFIKDNIFAYCMNRKDSLDIDEKIDFEIASYYFHEKSCE